MWEPSRLGTRQLCEGLVEAERSSPYDEHSERDPYPGPLLLLSRVCCLDSCSSTDPVDG